jgi:rhodanese-related sulfurtransferase
MWLPLLRLFLIATAIAAVAIAIDGRARAVLLNAPADDEWAVAQARAAGSAVLWIDARPAAEYDAGHVPGALLLNEDTWDDRIEPVLLAWTPGQTVLVYCSSHGCDASRQVAARLRRDYELPEVYVLRGGWEAWNAATGR